MIDPKGITIGTKLIHKTKGEIIVLGILQYNNNYVIITKDQWVYLKNCEYPKLKWWQEIIGAFKNRRY